MVGKLGYLVNKKVLVAIPAVFGDEELHDCRLVGVEAGGMWFESEAFPNIATGSLSLPNLVFVPLAQLACLAAAPVVAPSIQTSVITARNTRGGGTRKKPR